MYLSPFEKLVLLELVRGGPDVQQRLKPRVARLAIRFTGKPPRFLGLRLWLALRRLYAEVLLRQWPDSRGRQVYDATKQGARELTRRGWKLDALESQLPPDTPTP